MDPRIAAVVAWFSRIYLGGIPQLVRDETAFLSFVCMLAGTEALAGFHHPEGSGAQENGKRFRNFVSLYFPAEFKPLAAKLWQFRNGMAHGFSPRQFALTHHNSQIHLRTTSDGAAVLNAEDFFAAFLFAAQRYFTELATSAELQAKFLARLDSPSGGSISVGFVDVLQPPAA